jgi:hypothetical protein
VALEQLRALVVGLEADGEAAVLLVLVVVRQPAALHRPLGGYVARHRPQLWGGYYGERRDGSRHSSIERPRGATRM